jgi:hypothetical protein
LKLTSICPQQSQSTIQLHIEETTWLRSELAASNDKLRRAQLELEILREREKTYKTVQRFAMDSPVDHSTSKPKYDLSVDPAPSSSRNKKSSEEETNVQKVSASRRTEDTVQKLHENENPHPNNKSSFSRRQQNERVHKDTSSDNNLIVNETVPFNRLQQLYERVTGKNGSVLGKCEDNDY